LSFFAESIIIVEYHSLLVATCYCCYQSKNNTSLLGKYASASAAIQNVLLSLHAESIATKWATGPILYTPAFRQLMDSQPTDRIVGLIMIGGQNSAILVDPREEQITNARRCRRRKLYGDVLIDRP
jgi:hypothetical protein